jgi:hypothetical protein
MEWGVLAALPHGISSNTLARVLVLCELMTGSMADTKQVLAQ